jgi:tryptophan-rich sensory protein
LGGNQAVTKATLGAIAICFVAAALEGLFAGRGVKHRLAQLRQPPHSPPFAVWIAIGLCYYAICFVVLSRLISSMPSPLRWTAFAFMIALLIGNAAWNLVFFRRKNVDASAMVLMAYVAIALAVTILLILVDPMGALVFLPYLIYLAYATWWLQSLRRLNREVSGAAV